MTVPPRLRKNNTMILPQNPQPVKLSDLLRLKRPSDFGKLPFLIYDVETYADYFCVAFSANDADGNEISRGVVDTCKGVWELFLPCMNGTERLVGFNNCEFDDRIMLFVLEYIDRNDKLPPAKTIHELGNLIIAGQGGTYESKKERDAALQAFGVPVFGRFTLAGMSDDVRLSMGSRTPSLKVLESRLGMSSIEETPIPFDKPKLTEEERVSVGKYCLWDVLATRKLYLTMRDQCDSFGGMAQELEAEIAEVAKINPEDVEGFLGSFTHPEKPTVDGVSWLSLYDLRYLPQSQFAERYCRIQAFLAHARITGEFDPFVVLPPSDEAIVKHPKQESFVPHPTIPIAQDWQVRRWVGEGLGTLKYVLHERGSRGGKPQMHIGVTKAHTADAILLNNTLYRVGVGGIHSVDPPGIIKPNIESGEILVDLDVTSFYPALIVNLGVAPYQWPTHLQEAFQTNYKTLMEQRVELKGKIKKAEGVEKARFEALAYAYKIVLNSVYGKFRDRYSVLWSPSNTPKVTLHGQLLLLWCIERSGELGAKVVSANTDGFTILGTEQIKQTLMVETQAHGYTLEETLFDQIVRESISCYAARKPSGEIKCKGAMETKPSLTAEVKRPIVYDAVIGYLMHGTAVEETIQAAIDKRRWSKFAMMRKTSSRTTYNIVAASDPTYSESGKVFRYLWAKRTWVDPLGRSGYRLEKEGVESPKFGDEWDIMPARSWSQIDPDGIDISRYVAKAWEIIAKIMPATEDPGFLPKRNHSSEPLSPFDLWDCGIYPAANRGKIVLSGKKFSTMQPWGSATTLGCYTGARHNRLVVIDVDDPERFRKFLAYEKGKRKDNTEEFILPEPIDTMFSYKAGTEGNVQQLQSRGKLLFTVPDTDEFSSIVYLETLPPTAFNTKSRAKMEGGAGFDIFWGQGGSHPSLCGEREDGGEYVFSCQLLDAPSELPGWLWKRIESHYLPSDRERVKVKNAILDDDNELSVEETESDSFLSERYGLDVAPTRESAGVEFGESYGEQVSPSHRGSTWITDLIDMAIDRAATRLYPNTALPTRSHYSIPGFSPHAVEITCFGKHSNMRGGKTIVAMVEDRETGEPRIIYKCFGSSCQSEQSGWRTEIQAEFDALMAERREKVLERLRANDDSGATGYDDDNLDTGGDFGGDDGTRPETPRPTQPTNGGEEYPDSPDVEEKRVLAVQPAKKPSLSGLNGVAQWLLGSHVVGAFHQPMGSGKGYGSAQAIVENLIAGKLTLYVAPRNAQLYGFRTEIMGRMIQYRTELTRALGDLSALTGARFTNVARLTDLAFAQEICDKLVVVVNAENHVEEINLKSQMVILTNPYYLGQKGDTGKAHPFSYQLMDHSIRLGRPGTIIFDEYHDTVREAWTKSMPVRVRYREVYSQQHSGLIPRVISHCPAKGSGWSGKSQSTCDGCLSCAAPATLRSDHGVLSWKKLTMVSHADNEGDHPFQEAADAPLLELGETGEWVPITMGKTQSYTQVQTVKIGGNLNWGSGWVAGAVAGGWRVPVKRWSEEKLSHASDKDRRKSIYQRDRSALAYNLQANFGIRAVMDTPLDARGVPITSQEDLAKALEESGHAGIRYPRNACLSPEIQWIDATAWYRMVDYIEQGWNVRFLSATVSEEALDHVTILANHIDETYDLPTPYRFSLETRESPENMKLEEVLVIGTGLCAGTVAGVISTRRNTQLLSVASDKDGSLVPNRMAVFFGRQRESEAFWERFSSKVDFHPWWGLHHGTTLHVQHVIAQSSQDVAESLWMSGGERRTMEHPHILSYLYGSLSTGANIRNLRTLVVDYSTPPPLRAHLSNYRDVDAGQLKADHAKAFGSIVAQVAGRALRYRDAANRAVILICGVESHADFQHVVANLPLEDRASLVNSRYISDPNDLMPVMYRFLNRLKAPTVESVAVEPKAPSVEITVSPEFQIPPTKTKESSQEGSTATPRGVRGACEAVHAAVEDGESWVGFKDRLKLSKLSSEELAQVKLVWDETKVAVNSS